MNKYIFNNCNINMTTYSKHLSEPWFSLIKIVAIRLIVVN